MRVKKMDNETRKKFETFRNHIKEVLCYLVYEFGYGNRLKQKSDIIPKVTESVFRPNNSHKTGTKWSHGDATLTYGLDNHGNEYTTLTTRGVVLDIPILPARKMAKTIDVFLVKFNEDKSKKKK